MHPSVELGEFVDDSGAAVPVVLSEQPLQRRRSKNPIRNMMQHLTVDSATCGEGTRSRRQSIMQRLSGRKSRSPSAHSEAASRGSSRPASALGTNADPALCEPCRSLAAEMEDSLEEMDSTFTRAANPGTADDFEKREYFLARLKDLEENRWAATCPLCQLFWAVRVPSAAAGVKEAKEATGEYSLLGMSSRDTSYLVDSHKMYELEHPARAKARGISPGFLAVVSKSQVPGARNPDVDPSWFRASGMLFRTRPESHHDGVAREEGRMRGMSESGGGRLAAPDQLAALSSSSSSPQARSNDGIWTQKGIWGREIGRTVDLGVGREWLRFCRSHHRGRCGKAPVERDLQGFRLLDCSQVPPQVVRGSLREDYVALSYVRGKPTGDGKSWPRVVLDAVAVTLGLGFRYLWVDQMCMDEGWSRGSVERTRHVERMDDIFHHAVVTVIAASGDDATQGLPGVGGTSRPLQPKYSFTTSRVTLVSSLQDPRLLVQGSTWYTRGWTYQEGLCARRRLIFTGEQMYWECDGMACPETLDLPLDFYHDAEEQRMGDFVRPGLFNGVSYVDGSWEQWKKLPRKLEEAGTLSVFREADQHISNYTRRGLTYDEDSLDGFLGIWRRLETTLGRGRLSSLVGIPIWLCATTATAENGTATTSSPSETARNATRTRHLFALSTSFWHHRDGTTARRMRHLPSWTWAGWAGAVDLFSSVVIATDPLHRLKGRKVLNHHYVAATQLTRNEAASMKWTYSPEMGVVTTNADGQEQVVYDFGAGPVPKCPGRCALRVTDPLVLDHVKARTHPGGWMFNKLSVDVRVSGRSGGTDTLSPEGQPDMASIREYVGRHGSGEQMTILWFVEEAMVMLLVVERGEGGEWERVGRVRMAFAEEGKEVMRVSGDVEGMLRRLPLRRLGWDVMIY